MDAPAYSRLRFASALAACFSVGFLTAGFFTVTLGLTVASEADLTTPAAWRVAPALGAPVEPISRG